MRDYTVDGLIDEVKRRGSFPTDEQLLTKNGFIQIADEQLQSYIVPQIMEVREEYFVTYKDIPIVGGQAMYNIPYKAVGLKVRDITIVDNSGNERSIPRFRQEYKLSVDVYPTQTGPVYAHFFRGDQVGLYPTPNDSSDKLRVYYFRRPGELVTSDRAGQVTNIDTGTNTVTLASVPTSFSVGTDIDVISGRPGFSAVYDDITIQSRSGSDIGLTDVQNIQVGDWLTLSGTSPIAQIPVEAQRLLAQDVTVKVMEAIGDERGYKVAQQRYDTLYYHFLTTLTPRNEGEVEKVIGTDSISRHAATSGVYQWG